MNDHFPLDQPLDPVETNDDPVEAPEPSEPTQTPEPSEPTQTPEPTEAPVPDVAEDKGTDEAVDSPETTYEQSEITDAVDTPETTYEQAE